ncbi:MAG: hypothetical protein HC799_15795 [Limnothrix sp. RL_2_0]|nr:hypothetical protein [Limnothrix sp. RL_2_0]
MGSLHYQSNQLKVAVEPSELPEELSSIGVTLEQSVSEKDADLQIFDIAYGQSQVTLHRYLGELNAIGTSYITADLDGDVKPEFILIDAYEYASSSDISLDCSSLLGQTYFLGIHHSYVVYNFAGEKINKSCNIPSQYALYFSFFRGWFLTLPLVAISLYLLGTLSLMALFWAIAKSRIKPTAELSAANQPQPQNS